MCKIKLFSHFAQVCLYLSVLLLFISAQFANAGELSWRLVYSSDFRGELKPCGCTAEGDLGGVLRRASRFEQMRQEKMPTLFVSAGDILGNPDEQGKIKNRYMLAAQTKLKLDAILPGERDLIHPINDIAKLPLPWVLTNQAARTEGSFFSRFKEKRINNRRVFMIGLLDPDLLKNHPQIQLTDMVQALKDTLDKLKVVEQDIVILLIHAEEEKLKPFHQHPRVDIVVRGHLDREIESTFSETNTTPAVLTAGYRGQNIGIAKLLTQVDTRLMENRIETIPNTIADHPAMIRLYQEYDKEVAKWYRNKVLSRQQNRPDSVSPYASDKVCARCHVNTNRRWQKTRHAIALKSLVKAGKDNDPECLQCHTTGLDEKGGYLSQQTTPQLANVQCEACHGPASHHAAYPLVIKPEKAIGQCTTCHDKESSPSFALSQYWQKIIHQSEKGLKKHDQVFSPIQGEYTLLNEKEPIIKDGPIVVTEFFNFYCSRCNILNKELKEIISGLDKVVILQQIPITFSQRQSSRPAIAFLAAVKEGKGDNFKQDVFDAKFEDNLDIDEIKILLTIAERYGIDKAVMRAMKDKNAAELKEFQLGIDKMNRLGITATPTILINNNLKVTAMNSGNNINLMSENLEEILLDIQCRQHAICK